MLEKNPTLLILEFLTVSPSVPKEWCHALSPLPPVFLLHFKTKLSTTKNQWGLILHHITPILHNPTADKAIPLSYNRSSGKVPSIPYQLDRIADFGPLPILSCRHRHKKHHTLRGGRMTLPVLFWPPVQHS